LTLLSWNVLSVAQAWVPPKGEGDYTIAYQNLFTKDHLNSAGARVNAGKVRMLGLVQGVDFGVSNKLAVSANLPIGWGKYNGALPHQLPIDGGTYHGSLQDIGFGVRYNIRSRPLVLTPFVFATVPSHGYEHFAHSAIGANMWEVRLGVNVGHRFRSIPGYWQMQYSYVITERILGIRPNKSRLNAEFGYFLTRRFSVNALVTSQFTHSGLEQLGDFPNRTPTNELWRHHDQISRVNSLNIGGGISFSPTPSVNVFSSLVTTAWGANGHALATGLTTGVSWSFRTPWARRVPLAERSDTTLEAAAFRPKYPPIQCAH
jgi:hypothetical protein